MLSRSYPFAVVLLSLFMVRRYGLQPNTTFHLTALPGRFCESVTTNVAERAIHPAVMWHKLGFGTQRADGSRVVVRSLRVRRQVKAAKGSGAKVRARRPFTRRGGDTMGAEYQSQRIIGSSGLLILLAKSPAALYDISSYDLLRIGRAKMLHQSAIAAIPIETARVAPVAFPDRHGYLQLADEAGTLFTDTLFISLYPSLGQPAFALWRLALVTMLLFAEGLSDR